MQFLFIKFFPKYLGLKARNDDEEEEEEEEDMRKPSAFTGNLSDLLSMIVEK